MSFTINGAVEDVYSCDECSYCSTEKHFRDDGSCVLCNGSSTKISEIEPTTGMSDFKYRQLQELLEEDAAGVGATTVENITEHFDEGQDFLDAAEAAYQEMELAELEAVDGVGNASAKEIALTVAEHESWEDGALFVL
jgi:ERCC4-type nuclease